MRIFKAGFAALVLSTALIAGCSPTSGARGEVTTDPKAVEAMVAKLVADPFKGKATAAADLEGLRAALPKEVALSWGNISFDAATGATVLTNVKLSPSDMPAIGIGIAELRLWDFDAEFAKARLSGQRLTETASLASRIDAKDVSIFGMADMMNAMMGGFAAPVDPTQPPVAADPNAPPTIENPPGWPSVTEPEILGPNGMMMSMPSFDRYDFGFGRLVLSDVVLRPYEMKPAPAAAPNAMDPFAAMGPFGQQYYAVSRTFAVDTMAAMDMKGELAMTQMGQTTQASFTAKSMGTHGWRGGDFDASYARDMALKFAMSEQPMTGMPAMDFDLSYGLFTMEDVKFDKLYSYMANGVAPPRTETNVMSFGLWRTENEAWKFGGEDIYTVAETMLDARGFHWLVPTDIKMSGKNASLNVGALMKMAESAADSMGAYLEQIPQAEPVPGEPAPEVVPEVPAGPTAAEQMRMVMASLEKNGLSKINMNYDAGWNWNAGSGDAKLNYSFAVDKFLKVDTVYEGGFPAFKAVSDLVPDDPAQANFAAIETLFGQKSTLKLLDFNITDEGGLDKIFGVMSDLSPMMMGGTMTKENVRMMAGAGLSMVAASTGSEIPEMASLINPVVAFIQTGGKLHLQVKPAKPMPFTQAGASFEVTSPAGVGTAMREFGVKAEHSGGTK